MVEYRYITLRRPAGPGSVPTRGLQYVEDGDRWRDGYWSLCHYDRPLTKQELEDYEMMEVVDVEKR